MMSARFTAGKIRYWAAEREASARPDMRRTCAPWIDADECQPFGRVLRKRGAVVRADVEHDVARRQRLGARATFMLRSRRLLRGRRQPGTGRRDLVRRQIATS